MTDNITYDKKTKCVCTNPYTCFRPKSMPSPRKLLKKILKNWQELLVNTPASFVVSLPTSIMCGLQPIAGEGGLASLDSFDTINQRFMDAPIYSLTLAALGFTVSQAVLTSLNRNYLKGSALTTLSLLKRDINYLIKTLLRREIEPDQVPTLTENILFGWCFITSLIFAELGKETLSFLGEPGRQTGFYLNLMVYFATRFAGARMFFKSWVEPVEDQALIDANLITEPTLLSNLIKKASTGMALIGSATISLSFIPESVKGLQSLLHTNLGADSAYQNPISLSIGFLGSLPTAFFYYVAIQKLLPTLTSTASISINKVKQKKFKDASVITILTLTLFMASFFTSIGFRMVGDDNIDNGYVSYLNDYLQIGLREGLFASIVMMFWSHLQHSLNTSYEEVEPENDQIDEERLQLLAIQ